MVQIIANMIFLALFAFAPNGATTASEPGDRVSVILPLGWIETEPEGLTETIPGVVKTFAKTDVSVMATLVAYDAKHLGSPKTAAEVVRLVLKYADFVCGEIVTNDGAAGFAFLSSDGQLSGRFEINMRPTSPRTYAGFLGVWLTSHADEGGGAFQEIMSALLP